MISQYDESAQKIGSTVKSVSWGDLAAKKQTDVSLCSAPFAVNDPTLKRVSDVTGSRVVTSATPQYAVVATPSRRIPTAAPGTECLAAC